MKDVMAKLKAEGRYDEIKPAIQAMKANRQTKTGVPEALAFVEGNLFDAYVHDMKIVQHFAAMNRKAMTAIVLEGMGWTEIDRLPRSTITSIWIT
jgi:RNA-splicing ligase RtcB